MEKIINDTDYEKVMARIETLMDKGSQNISKEELDEISEMSLLAQNYEQETILPLKIQ
jgi:HTH-type transcriptional regulator / antitoxin HigA